MKGGTNALILTIIGTLSIVTYVHLSQKREIKRMKESVLLDAERESYRRRLRAETTKSNNDVQLGAGHADSSRAVSQPKN